MNNRSKQSGFALLTVLVLVALAGVSLAAMAHRSLTRAVEAVDVVQELQRRWAITSLRRALMPAAEELLDLTERGDGSREQRDPQTIEYRNRPTSHLRIECRLAGHDYLLVVTDEQAKVNVNALLALYDRSDAQAWVKRLTETSVGVGSSPAVTLRPLTLLTRSSSRPSIGSYGQIFENPGPDQLLPGQASSLAGSMTCWGGGQLNIRRASARAIAAVCEKAADSKTIARLIQTRDANPYRKFPEMLAEVGAVDPETRNALLQRLTDSSDCHALWIVDRGAQRSWYSFAVFLRGNNAKATSQLQEFSW